MLSRSTLGYLNEIRFCLNLAQIRSLSDTDDKLGFWFVFFSEVLKCIEYQSGNSTDLFVSWYFMEC